MKLSLTLVVLLLVFVFAGVALASVTTHTYVAPPGWSLMGLKGIPLDPDPVSVFGSEEIIDSKLIRWNAVAQGMHTYNMFDPELFGNILFTDGYWLDNISGSNETISFSGLNDNDTMDIWVSLPKQGWTMIGYPFSYPFLWKNAKVTDGNTTKSLYDASQWGANWISSVGFGWDEVGQGMFDIGIEEYDYPMEVSLRPWHGYWIESKVDKTALILESIP